MNDLILVESKTAREGFMERIDVLDKVKNLVALPDDFHVTVQMAADYFNVPKQTIKNLIFDHKQEIESDGMRVLKGNELGFLKKPGLIDKRTPSLTVLPRRAVLRIAMLLRDSEVAKQVRSYLLDAELGSRRQVSLPDPFEVMKVVGFHIKTWMNLFEQTKVPVETKGAVLKSIYEYAGMSIPIEFTDSRQKPKQVVDNGGWCTCTHIAKEVDVYSITKKPHVQLVSALIRKAGVTPDEYKLVSDPFADGKDVMHYLYKPSVVQKVAKLLDDLKRPTSLKLDRVYNIVYLKHITTTKFVEA